MTCDSTWTLASSQATNWPFIQIFSLLVIAMAAALAGWENASSRSPLAERVPHMRRDAPRVLLQPPPALLIRLERGAEGIEHRQPGLPRRRPLIHDMHPLDRCAHRQHGRAMRWTHHQDQ